MPPRRGTGGPDPSASISTSETCGDLYLIKFLAKIFNLWHYKTAKLNFKRFHWSETFQFGNPKYRNDYFWNAQNVSGHFTTKKGQASLQNCTQNLTRYSKKVLSLPTLQIWSCVVKWPKPGNTKLRYPRPSELFITCFSM